MDITTIPTDEMLRDRDQTVRDIAICREALTLGIATYGHGESVRLRLDTNLRILDTIKAELERRRVAA